MSSISIYPNPINDILNINGIFESIEIFDIYGKLVLISNQDKINTSNLSEGIYTINIKNNNNIITKRIVIAR